jgi:hypothetical protein
MVDIDRITGDVIDVAIRIHRDLGPGLLESVYEPSWRASSPRWDIAWNDSVR